jgi:hypothetical protein
MRSASSLRPRHHVRRSGRGHRRFPRYYPGEHQPTLEQLTDRTLTRVMWLTASCALPTAASRHSTLRAWAQDSARARFPKASTSRARSRDTTLTITT